jgi:MFS family permease
MSTQVDSVLTPQKLTQTIFISLVYLVGNLSNAIYPVFVSGMLASGKVTTSEVGVLATAEMLPFGLSILLAGVFLREKQLRLVAAGCLAIQIILGYASSQVDYEALLFCRAAFGVANGILVWLAFAYLARSLHASKLVAIFIVILMSTGIIISWLEPSYVMPTFGFTGVLLMLVIPSAVTILFLPFCPNELEPLPTSAETGKKLSHIDVTPAAWFLLGSVGFWSISMTVYWVYASPLSEQYGHGIASYWLTVSLICQVLGAGTASLLAERLPYRITITTGLILSAAIVGSMLVGVSALQFVILNGLSGFLGYFLVSFYIAGAIHTDPTRHSVVYFPAAQNLVGSLGPIAVSQFVSDTDLSSGLIMSFVAVALALSLFWIGMAIHRKTALRRSSKIG